MLALSRKVGERIVINGKIIVEVVQIDGNRVRLGIKAPREITILREELLPKGEALKPLDEGDAGD